ncbi:MAG: (Fe-S)-binding protein [Candidatus Methanomethylicaceae archaeon]
MQVEKIDITEKAPCLLEPRKLQVSAQVNISLSEILPILFLALPHSNYSKAFGSVTFLLRGKLVSIYSSGKINLGCVVREEIAVALLDDIKNLINKAFQYYESHGSPDPKLVKMKGKVAPLEIYNYLPKINCKECGEQGCFPFAIKLSNGEKTLQECPPIKEAQYAENRLSLERMLQPIKLE